jgi:hypothetical protein
LIGNGDLEREAIRVILEKVQLKKGKTFFRKKERNKK